MIAIWDARTKETALELMSYIFALWTLQSSSEIFDGEKDSNDPSKFLLKPRAAQVISIIRMLCMDDKESTLIGNLVEIGTGEGKSLTLAVACCVLALMGFDVSCACYSKYLSQRDFEAFKSLFDDLGVLNSIHYGTFNQLCERAINDGGNVRELVQRAILGNNNDNGDDNMSNNNHYDEKNDQLMANYHCKTTNPKYYSLMKLMYFLIQIFMVMFIHQVVY